MSTPNSSFEEVEDAPVIEQLDETPTDPRSRDQPKEVRVNRPKIFHEGLKICRNSVRLGILFFGTKFSGGLIITLNIFSSWTVQF